VRDANDRSRVQYIPVIEFGFGKSGIDLTQLDAGVYFIVVADTKTASSTTLRIVKKQAN
jgi:hypothetical protein